MKELGDGCRIASLCFPLHQIPFVEHLDDYRISIVLGFFVCLESACLASIVKAIFLSQPLLIQTSSNIVATAPRVNDGKSLFPVIFDDPEPLAAGDEGGFDCEEQLSFAFDIEVESDGDIIGNLYAIDVDSEVIGSNSRVEVGVEVLVELLIVDDGVVVVMYKGYKLGGSYELISERWVDEFRREIEVDQLFILAVEKMRKHYI